MLQTTGGKNRYRRFLPRTISQFSARHCLSLAAILLQIAICLSAVDAMAQSDTSVRQQIKKGMLATKLGDLSEGERVLRGVLAAEPESADAKIELAFNLNKQRRLLEAYNLLLPVLDADKKDARALSVMGTIMLSGGRFAEAQAFFRRAVDIDHNQDLAWAGHGLLEFYENRIEAGLMGLRQAIYIRPREPDYLYALAQVASRAEHYREAADAYSSFLAAAGITDVDRRERIKGLISFLKYLGDRPVLYDLGGSDQTSIPMQVVDDRPVIEVYVNGNERTLKFVLDTGSGMSVISTRTAKQLKIKEVARGGYGRGIGGDGKFALVYGFLKEIAVGDVHVHNVPVYIREFHQTNNADGYIGLSLLSKFLATVDYGTKTFALSRKDTDSVFSDANSKLVLPLRLTSSGFLSGEVNVSGIDANLNFIVDTGASISVISDRVANADSIKLHLSDEKHTVIGSAGVTEGVSTFFLPKVSFGPNTRSKVAAIALNLDLINEASGFEQAGILGGNFLKNYRLTFDFRRARVAFTPNAEPN